jgi:hypothetical protein
MGRFLVIFVAVGFMVALTVTLLGAKWGGFITGGVAGILIAQFVHARWQRS